jgi:hypothetical protein
MIPWDGGSYGLGFIGYLLEVIKAELFLWLLI